MVAALLQSASAVTCLLLAAGGTEHCTECKLAWLFMCSHCTSCDYCVAVQVVSQRWLFTKESWLQSLDRACGICGTSSPRLTFWYRQSSFNVLVQAVPVLHSGTGSPRFTFWYRQSSFYVLVQTVLVLRSGTGSPRFTFWYRQFSFYILVQAVLV